MKAWGRMFAGAVVLSLSFATLTTGVWATDADRQAAEAKRKTFRQKRQTSEPKGQALEKCLVLKNYGGYKNVVVSAQNTSAITFLVGNTIPYTVQGTAQGQKKQMKGVHKIKLTFLPGHWVTLASVGHGPSVGVGKDSDLQWAQTCVAFVKYGS